MLVVTSAMQDMQSPYRIRYHAIEDQIVPMDAPSDVLALAKWDQRIAMSPMPYAEARLLQFLGETQGSRRIVPGDPVADIFKISFGRLGKDNLHCLDFAIF